MSILNRSVQTLQEALKLQGQVAAAELQDRARRENLEAAQSAQRMQTLGMIGGAATPYALDYITGLRGTGEVLGSPGLGAIRSTGAPAGSFGLPQMSPTVGGPEIGSAAQLQGAGASTAEALGLSTAAPQMSLNPGLVDAAGQLATGGADAALAAAGAGGTAGAGAGAAGAAGTAGGTAAAGTGGAAATGVPGTMSSLAGSLGSIAAPVGIALGVGFLLNKLFG